MSSLSGLVLAHGSPAGLEFFIYVSVFSLHSPGHLCFWEFAECWLIGQEQLGMYLLSFRKLDRLVYKVVIYSKKQETVSMIIRFSKPLLVIHLLPFH